MSPDAVTVNVLTGFLGAGKTSLLKRLLALPALADTAVLINEFGEVGLDHLLLERLDDDVVLLKSGCLCCTIRGDLKDALTGLHARRARGAIPRFARLAIETTGLADPAPIVATLTADPALRYHFRTGAVVTVVDAVNGAETLRRHPESVRQAAVADRLVLSKADLAAPEAAAALTARLARLNPGADIVTLDAAAPAPPDLFADIERGVHGAGAPPRWLTDAPPPPENTRHHHHDTNRHGAVRAFTLTAETPLDWARFGLWLSMLLNRHGENILRIKGLLRIDGVATPVVVHGVQHLIHTPTHLSAWPAGWTESRLVVIAQHLDPALVARSFRAFNGLAPAAA